MNLAEFYYKTAEKRGAEQAEVWYLQVRRYRVTAVAPDEQITRQAELWKVRRRELSPADCFALAARAAFQLTVSTSVPELLRSFESPP